MASEVLEERLMEYMHLNYARLQLHEPSGIRPAGEAAVVLDSKRIVYFWNTYPTGELASVVVPGVLVKERYRRNSNGNVLSLVKPVADESKPSLERTIWFEMVKLSGLMLPDKIQFDYWSYSDLPDSDAAQRSQQRE